MNNKLSNQDFYSNNFATSNEALHDGLRNYMNAIYKRMSMGLFLSAAVAYFVSSNEAIMATLMNSGLIYVALFGILGLGFFSNKIIMTASLSTANMFFWGTTALWGVALSPYAVIYTGSDLAKSFLATSIAFAGTSLIGYTTKKDLTAMGRVLSMMVWGVLAILIINIFFGLNDFLMDVIMPIVIIGIFSGLTAYETQNLKSIFFQVDSETRSRVEILGALSLFGNFVTMFIWMLQLLGGSRE